MNYAKETNIRTNLEHMIGYDELSPDFWHKQQKIATSLISLGRTYDESTQVLMLAMLL